MNERSDASKSTEGELSTADVAHGRTRDSDTEGERMTTASERERLVAQQGDAAQTTPLLPHDQTTRYQERWQTIQTRFVDEPRASAKEADSLVAEVIQQLASRFADEREQLEKAWSSGSDVSTEDLRQALQHYRSFFQRLLSA